MMQENLLIGRITRLQIFKVPEFGTRASFSLERLGQGAVTCSVAGDVAREFVNFYREGDFVVVNGPTNHGRPRPHLSVPGPEDAAVHKLLFEVLHLLKPQSVLHEPDLVERVKAMRPGRRFF